MIFFLVIVLKVHEILRTAIRRTDEIIKKHKHLQDPKHNIYNSDESSKVLSILS